MTLTSSEKHLIIKYMSFPLSIISILSTFFIFLLYCLNHRLKTFPFRLIVYPQMSDFILSLSTFLIFFEDTIDQNTGFLCEIQAYLMQYGVLSTNIWSAIIVTLMLLSFSYESRLLEEYEKILIVIGFLIPAMVAVMYYI